MQVVSRSASLNGFDGRTLSVWASVPMSCLPEQSVLAMGLVELVEKSKFRKSVLRSGSCALPSRASKRATEHLAREPSPPRHLHVLHASALRTSQVMDIIISSPDNATQARKSLRCDKGIPDFCVATFFGSLIGPESSSSKHVHHGPTSCTNRP